MCSRLGLGHIPQPSLKSLDDGSNMTVPGGSDHAIINIRLVLH